MRQQDKNQAVTPLQNLKILRLSQNFSSLDSLPRFIGKSGLLTAFPRAWHKTNRVLGQYLLFYISVLGRREAARQHIALAILENKEIG